MTDDKTLTEMAKNAGRTLLDRLNTSIVDFGIADDLKVCKAYSDESNVNVRITPGLMIGTALILGVMRARRTGLFKRIGTRLGIGTGLEEDLVDVAKEQGMGDEEARQQAREVIRTLRLGPWFR